MSDPAGVAGGAPEDVRGADQELRRGDASQPQIGDAAATEMAAQCAPRPRDDNSSSFMQRRAARPQSAPLNNIRRRPSSAGRRFHRPNLSDCWMILWTSALKSLVANATGGGGGARRHRPGSAQSVVHYKVVRPCEMRQVRANSSPILGPLCRPCNPSRSR